MATKNAPKISGVMEIDPALIMVGSNVRFGLKESRIESMMESIAELGGVRTPLKVSVLNPPVDGHEYFLNEGHYRHAAALRLNSEQGAGITVPVDVEEPESDVIRMKRQIAENHERENLTPMDKAVAIKALMDAGVSRMDIRKMLSAAGGRKGNKVQPVSNSYLNMHMSFLTLSKAIQEKIHDGRIGTTAAYELTKLPADKRAEFLQKIEDVRIAELEKEDKDEEKFLESERKQAELNEKKEATEKDLVEKQAAVKLAEDEHKAKVKAAKDAFDATHAATTPEEKKAAQEHFKAADADAKAAEKKKAETAKEVEKAEKQAQKLRETTAAAKKKLEDARAAKATSAKSKAVSGKEVKSVAVGKSLQVPLTLAELRATFETEGKSKTNTAKIKRIFWIMGDIAMGVKTPKQAIKALQIEITGELKEEKK